MGSANENMTLHGNKSLIGWTHTQNDPQNCADSIQGCYEMVIQITSTNSKIYENMGL